MQLFFLEKFIYSFIHWSIFSHDLYTTRLYDFLIYV